MAARCCALSALLLGACASTAWQLEPSPEIAAPAAWSINTTATGEPTSLAQWWQRFDDPLLADLVKQALQNNTSVNTARAALRQAWALRDVAAAALWPTLAGSASAQHGTSGGNSTGNVFKAGLNANWALDVFGANRSALNAGTASAEASAASLGDMRVAIASELGLNYILLRSAQARLVIANANLANQEEILQITRWRQQAGLVTVLEVEQARASAEQTRAQLPALQTGIEQSRHALAVLTGQPPAALAQVLSAAIPVPQPAADIALNIPAETLRQAANSEGRT